ncbi:uncharacterized protein LOC133906040 [Phragmites australis]|uniref:uncharacterized protein LOC133906040 n=1 Tax=Phragmites australis TaxID=29695 RepID=UPI002D77E6EC|nr:uncharacterized protein LOC133906040 [Phragmites australis]
MAHPPPPAEMTTTYPVKEITEAVAFLDNIVASFESNPGVRDEFFAVVTGLGDGGVDARYVVDRASELLGGHPDLLAEFRTFLPGAEVPKEDLAATRPRRSSRKRKRESRCRPVPKAERNVDVAAGADDAQGYKLLRKRESGNRAAAGAGGDANEDPQFRKALELRALRIDEGSTDCRAAARGHEDDDVPLQRSKKPRRHAHRVGQCSGGGGASRGHDNYDVPPYRMDRKLCAVDYNRRHAHWVGEGSGIGSIARIQDDDDIPRYKPRKPCRRATNGEGSSAEVAARAPGSRRDDEVMRFRQAWEFETGYSKMVATMARMVELLKDGSYVHMASLEELFPSRECREFLKRFYGGETWRAMREALEDAERTGPALEVLLRRLRQMDDNTIEDARKRRDRARAAERLNELVTDMLDAWTRSASGTRPAITLHERRAWPAVSVPSSS